MPRDAVSTHGTFPGHTMFVVVATAGGMGNELVQLRLEDPILMGEGGHLAILRHDIGEMPHGTGEGIEPIVVGEGTGLLGQPGELV
jgi:hypothetical protein